MGQKDIEAMPFGMYFVQYEYGSTDLFYHAGPNFPMRRWDGTNPLVPPQRWMLADTRVFRFIKTITKI